VADVTPVLDTVAAERDVIALDLPGFGESLALDGDAPSVPALAESVAAFRARPGRRTPARGRQLARRRGGARARADRRGAVGLRAVPAGFAQGWEVRYALTSLRIARVVARALAPVAAELARSARMRRATSRQLIEHPERVPPRELASASRNLARSPGFRATLRAVHDWSEPDAGPAAVRDHDRVVRARPAAALPAAERAGTRAPAGRAPRHARRLRARPDVDDPQQVARVLLEASRD
jgi:hypothetical protein